MTDTSLCIETVSGNLVNPGAPDPDSISLHDIAWSLSRTPRFVGHTVTEIAYNVAQHSIHVSNLVENFLNDPQQIWKEYGHSYLILSNAEDLLKNKKSFLLWSLLHDGHEAYIGDLPSPVKRIPELRVIVKALENNLDKVIRDRFDIVCPNDNQLELLKLCDSIAQAIEGYQFMPSRGRDWNLPQASLIAIQQFAPPETSLISYKAFLERFNKLSNE